jgi:AcrR family transcriptional regulator
MYSCRTRIKGGAVTTQATRPRRSQEERSAETRERLLEATIECLLKYGYAGTTTPRIAELAGLTRGAQVHHFGSKNDLMLAAVQHLAAKRTTGAIAQFGGDLLAADDPLGAVLALLWDIHAPPIFIPIAELWVAGRTDPALSREVAKFETIALTAVMAGVAERVPEELAGPAMNFVYTAMDALRGILVSSFVDADPSRARRRWDRASANLRLIADPAVTAWVTRPR